MLLKFPCRIFYFMVFPRTTTRIGWRCPSPHMREVVLDFIVCYHHPLLISPCRQGWLYFLQRSKDTLKKCVQGMTLNCIWLWGSISGARGSVEYFLLLGPLIRRGSTCCSPIYGSDTFIQKLFVFDWAVGRGGKKKYIRNDNTKNVNMNVQWRRFRNFSA